MKKTILFLILVIFLSAGAAKCTLIQRPKSLDIYQGTEGIIMNFINGAPPDKISEDTEFQIIANIKNKGASNVENGYLTINLEKDYVDLYFWEFEEPVVGSGFNPEQVIFDLEGKSEYNINGGEGIIRITANAKEIGGLIESHTSNIGLTTCYGYSTTASPTICMDPDVYNLRVGEKPCSIKNINLDSQGAPVAITKIEQNMLTHENKIEPQFLIYIANKGNGQIVDKQKVKEACSGTGKYNLSIINVEAYLSGRELECTPDPIRLTRTKNFVRCSALEQDWLDKELLAYETVLNIKLSYGYTSTIAKEIEIEKSY